MQSKELNTVQQLLAQHLDIWTTAETEKKSGRGRSSDNKGTVYGIQKLRELILELAVRGKLVPQDPNDEPASELLKRIHAEKAKLIAEGKLKKDKPLAPISEDEKPFELPNGWEFSKLGFISQKLTDGSHNPPRDSGSGIPMLSSQNVNFGFINFNNPSRHVTYDEYEAENSRTRIAADDILLTIVGTLGRAAVVEENSPKFVLQRSVAAIKTGLLPKYLCLQFGSPFCNEYFEENGKGIAQKGIYLGQLAEMLITVPPLAEQDRIVAKVDELMALCDQLENQHLNASEAHETLLSELLATLTQSQNAADFNAKWQRIAAHFDVLFTTEASIDALKQTLLQLAVMGKLVQQDPNDEPASELLKRIQAEKAKLIAESKLKKEKQVAPIAEDEKPFELPKGWEWVRVVNLAEIKGGKRLPEGKTFSPVKTPYIYIQVTNMKNGTVIEENLKYIDEETRDLLKNYTISSQDLYITIAGTIGDVGTVPTIFDGMILTENAAKIIFKELDKIWFKHCFSSNFLREQFQEKTIQLAQPKLALHRVASCVIALPPLAEQHRIVAKVDALMALCDQLKTSIQQASQQQQLIADALVAQAVA